MAGQWLRHNTNSEDEADIVIRALPFDTLRKLDAKDRC
jgi:hypothetical protein